MTVLDRVGIIGAGNMGRAIAGGLSEAEDWSAENIFIYDIDEQKMRDVAGRHGLQVTENVQEVARETDFVILAVKPSATAEVLKKVSGECPRLLSIAAGVKIEQLAAHMEEETRIIRVMPNTPCQVGEGMSFLSCSANTGEEFLQSALSVFDNLGKTRVIKESQMDAATALGGSGPAYVFYFLEALQEAGVYLGFDSDDSLEAALQVLRGAVTIAEESDKSPARLRQDVSSPGGTTVEALKYLDEQGTRGIIEEALNRACNRSRELGGANGESQN